jgi:hypothetical protein
LCRYFTGCIGKDAFGEELKKAALADQVGSCTSWNSVDL